MGNNIISYELNKDMTNYYKMDVYNNQLNIDYSNGFVFLKIDPLYFGEVYEHITIPSDIHFCLMELSWNHRTICGHISTINSGTQIFPYYDTHQVVGIIPGERDENLYLEKREIILNFFIPELASIILEYSTFPDPQIYLIVNFNETIDTYKIPISMETVIPTVCLPYQKIFITCEDLSGLIKSYKVKIICSLLHIPTRTNLIENINGVILPGGEYGFIRSGIYPKLYVEQNIESVR